MYDSYQEIVDDVILMLDPQLLCDHFCKPKCHEPIADCFPELPGSIDAAFPFVLLGATVALDLDEAPCLGFCYPFIGGAPLAAARCQANLAAAACDIVGHLVQQSMSSKVLLRASRKTLASIEPVPSRLISVGFVVTAPGISSPSE